MGWSFHSVKQVWDAKLKTWCGPGDPHRALVKAFLGKFSSWSIPLKFNMTNLHINYINNRRKFRSQTSDNMGRWKAEQGRGREKRKIRREKIRRERVRRKKMQMREKVGKSRNTVFFQWFVAPEGRKVGSLKRRVRSQLARWEMKNCAPLWREADFQVKMHKDTSVGPLLEVEMLKISTPLWREAHFEVKMQNTPLSDHFWKLRCWKSARRCGAKHISKSKCTKHTMLRPLLEVEMSKKCTPLWREAHFQVKMYKTHQVRTTFGSWDVENFHSVVARSTFWSQNAQNTPFSDHFWKLRCWKFPRRCGAKHILKSKCTKHTIVGPLLEVEMLKKCTPLWREAHFEVKMYKTHHARTTFGGWDVEKVHAVAARSTFRSQNVQNTPCSDHFWKLRCRKSARRCGAKHISKSKCTKHTMLRPLLEVEMSKKCTPLWREAHFQVKMYKTHHCRTTFGSSVVEKVHAVVARSTFPSQNVQSTPGSRHF